MWNKPLKLEVRETLEIRVQPFTLLKGSRTQGERQVFQGRQLRQRTEFQPRCLWYREFGEFIYISDISFRPLRLEGVG